MYRCTLEELFQCKNNFFEIDALTKSISKFECSTEAMFDVSQDGNSVLGVFAGDNCKIICENLETKEATVFQDAHSFMVSAVSLVEDRNRVISGSFFNTVACHEYSSGNLLTILSVKHYCLQSIVLYDRFAILGFTEIIAVMDLDTFIINDQFIKFTNKTSMLSNLYRDPNAGENNGYQLVLGGIQTTSLKVYNVDAVYKDCPPMGVEYYTRHQPGQPEQEGSLGELGSDQEIELDMSDFSLHEVEDMEDDIEEVN